MPSLSVGIWISWTDSFFLMPYFRLLPASPASNAIQTCISVNRMLVFKAVLRLDYIGHHHNFASSDHLQVPVKRIRNLF
jgi:hypothetical protein